MSVIVTDAGFGPDDWQGEFVDFEQLDEAAHGIGLDLAPDADLNALAPKLPAIGLIRIPFGSFADGRGFTTARRLRMMGFSGRLRASGHVLADQYAMARRAGFDEVEIDDDLAARQPEGDWQYRADWSAHDHQSRLRTG